MKRVLHFVLVSLFLFLVSCDRDNKSNSEPESKPESFIPDDSRTLVSILSSSEYTPHEFISKLGSRSFASIINYFSPQIVELGKTLARIKLETHLPALDRDFANEVGTGDDDERLWHIESHTFSYRSISSDGREIVLSGRVTFPNNKVDGIPHEVNSLSLHSHQALMSRDWAPSESLMFMPLRSLWNSAVIEPDFQNYGINYGIEYDGHGSPIAMSRQLADCALAALEIMEKHGVTLARDGFTTSWGSSQAAAVPLAFAKYYETQAPEWFRNLIRLKSSYTGEGALELADIIDYYSIHPELLNFSHVYLCRYMSAFSREQLEGYDMKELVSPWLDTTYVSVGGQECSILDAILHYGEMDVGQKPAVKRLDQIFASDMIAPEGGLDKSSPKSQAFLNCLRTAGNLDDWTPQHPVYIAHCRKDIALPYDYAYNSYLKLSGNNSNPKVKWIDVYAPDGIESLIADITGTHIIVSIIMLLNMSCVEEPEDMTLIYK